MKACHTMSKDKKITQEISEILQSCRLLLLPTTHYYLRKHFFFFFENSMREKTKYAELTLRNYKDRSMCTAQTARRYLTRNRANTKAA